MRGLVKWLAALGCFIGASATAADFEGRSYVLDGAPIAAGGPLVMALHGMRGSGPQLRDSANLGPMAAGATIVYPTAPDGVWNDGRFDAIGGYRAARRAQQDDVAWLLGLARHLGRDRFFVIGHSNGGGMAMRLACDAEDHVLGVANVSTKMLMDFECSGRRSVPMVIFYGTDDLIAPHSGRPTGREGVLPFQTGRAHDADASVAYWARRNGCGEAQVTASDPDPTDSGTLRIHTYQDCMAPVVYYEMVGAGHAFPGADPVRAPRIRRVIGEAIRDVSAGKAAAAVWFGD